MTAASVPLVLAAAGSVATVSLDRCAWREGWKLLAEAADQIRVPADLQEMTAFAEGEEPRWIGR